MYYIYFIRSLSHPDQIYIGYTENLQERLNAHNSGNSIHTSKYTPWELLFYSGFKEKSKAIAFEKYLKSQSGRAFALKRLV